MEELLPSTSNSQRTAVSPTSVPTVLPDQGRALFLPLVDNIAYSTSVQKIRDPVKKTTTNTYVPQFINEDGVTNNVEGFTEIKQNNINHTARVKPRGHVVIYQKELIVDRSALTEPKLITR
ncbi:hypothetical protein Pcinc_035919 [Petrolisthes cinctipes]|uniref:Uncharacterized protein n=1 Tax=Petrolisthes cinctipes TaxID=88211 RepID=A0AAE1BVS0_PETCI|nr:hypothetical protein Pcinc_035919 [Petrolisthes cinctipes]